MNLISQEINCSILFFDAEINPEDKKILDLGVVSADGLNLPSKSIAEFTKLVEKHDFVCGHNIISHDMKYLPSCFPVNKIEEFQPIDTLFLSPLLFPDKPYHHLLKSEKFFPKDMNNPISDSQKARDLFFDEVSAFQKLPKTLQQIYYNLLKNQIEFKFFFKYLVFDIGDAPQIHTLIHTLFLGKICNNALLTKWAQKYPVELAYCLALIYGSDPYSITPKWVLKTYPKVESIIQQLCNTPCFSRCSYCNMSLNARGGLKKFFGFDSFRSFDGLPLQEEVVNAALNNKSLLAVFPTGGGKSLAFQVPALLAGETSRGLTVIISPLQSLMKDQVDNLEKIGITESVTINGLLDPVERGKSFQRVENGSAHILYISPESLRSKTILNLLLGRNIIRFVIDEAHCFSAWGQDFRVDYLYIGKFIKQLQEKKNLPLPIPVSCFTATAKLQVVIDIKKYFKETLSLELSVYKAKSSRPNLHYEVLNGADDEAKYQKTRDLVQDHDCPTIIYVSTRNRARLLAERLAGDGFAARPYHGKMETGEKIKNQNAFVSGEIQIMVATSAFGMGVDKKDIKMIIHHEISNSLENYVQEAGRAGRDENIHAECFVLFNEDDLNWHFNSLNRSKLSISEISQIWNAIKSITKFRSNVSRSALEIARKAGWDDEIADIETRVKTAIAALEHSGYLKREHNNPRIFANSILSENAIQAVKTINNSTIFSEPQKQNAIRIIKKLLSQKSTKHQNNETPESRIDYISFQLGIEKREVIKTIMLLRDAGILADTKDLNAYINCNETETHSLSILKYYIQIEKFLVNKMPEINDCPASINLKELNEAGLTINISKITPKKITIIINLWVISKWITRSRPKNSKNHIFVTSNLSINTIKKRLIRKHLLSESILKYLFKKAKLTSKDPQSNSTLVEFSIHELKEFCTSLYLSLFKIEADIDDIEESLFFLSRIEAINIQGSFLVIYNGLTIQRLELNNHIRYKKDDYSHLEQYYENKKEQIHIVGKYASKLLEDYEDALQFVEDYFQMEYSLFLKKHFPGKESDEIKNNLTPKKFKQLFGELSPRQLQIINDSKNNRILVAAGPGSGKTRLLVHKLASLLLMEDVRTEQLLMLTFSRAAATEFKKRLIDLIGKAAYFVDVKTFHSFCFDLQGLVGNVNKSKNIIHDTVIRIESDEIESSKITKSVLVIDEAQDMNHDEFALVTALLKKNENMRLITVGDDDQNIFEFRGASSKYFEKLIQGENSARYELLTNYRSRNNLVEYSGKFIQLRKSRLKSAHVSSSSTQHGIVSVTQYKHPNLVNPLVNQIVEKALSGTTAVLTTTNNQALLLTGALLNKGLPAKLIQTSDNFRLINVVEIRDFFKNLTPDVNTATIDEKDWCTAEETLKNEYGDSSNYELCLTLFKDFKKTNHGTRYVTDLKIFINESKLEDFTSIADKSICVSTIHKAKGKEFNNVFLMLEDFNLNSDSNIRELYVAMTRAKENLFIHYNADYLKHISVVNGFTSAHNIIENKTPDHLLYRLTHKDVILSYFRFVQHRINPLRSGDSLGINNEGLVNKKNEQVLKFSKSYRQRIETLAAKGLTPKRAKILFMLHWQDKEKTQKEVKIILPELLFT